MRLTLRTLLAYLDDTLQASEIKEIGVKVGESDAAQELIARIKAVTRRRRLTAPPPTGPGGLDPNRVAEYLDNELGADELAELEKLALESDVHLAEIAACHQILTLVLGEPALVPPTARERMYGLVQGREAIPFRKVAPVRAPSDHLDEDETIGLGGGWLKWVLPAAGLLLVVALGLAVYQILPSRDKTHASTAKPVSDGEDVRGKEPDNNGKEENKNNKDNGKAIVPGEKGKGKDKETGGASGSGTASETEPDKPPEKDPAVVERTTPPLKGRVDAGQYVGGFSDLPSVFVAKTDNVAGWKHVPREATVSTDDTLVALPGFTAEIRTRKGVRLQMRGHLPQFSVHPMQDYLSESAVILHKNDQFDLDLTLLRGRVYLRNIKDKGEVKVRLRFLTEVWDMTLGDGGSEVGVDLLQFYMPGINYRADEEPRANLGLCLFQGELGLKVDAYNTNNLEAERPKAAIVYWDSFTKVDGPRRLEKAPVIWDKTPPAPETVPESRGADIRRMTAALKNLEVLLSDKKKTVDVALKESLEKQEIASRVLAIYCLAAIDQTFKLVEVLGDENTDHWIDRLAANFALRRWISRSAAQGKVLYDAKNEAGVLISDLKFKKREAETIYELLHDISSAEWNNPEIFEVLEHCLHSKRVAIAELGYYHLLQLSRGTKLPTGFNAASPLEAREAYAQRIHMMIANKQLPPQAIGAPGAPGAPGAGGAAGASGGAPKIP